MKITPFLILALLPAFIIAQNVDTDDAMILARKFMSAKAEKNISPVSVSLETKGVSHMHFFTDENNTSFVVIAGNKKSHPVIAYSTESGIPADMPEVVADYFRWVEAQMIECENTSHAADAKVTEEWEALANTGVLPASWKSTFAPLLSTTWNQGCYYNDSVPLHASGPCGRCYAGCVATAMGQVMKYHNYPPVGVGSNIYGTGSYSNIHVDFSQATYDWAGMPNSISAYNEPIAKLLYHLGVSVNMGYAFDGSGANSQDAAESMVDHFAYSDYSFYIEKEVFTDTDWLWVISNDLGGRRPVYYSGFGDAGGHAFVCDGINSSGLVHINWGWSGSGNGYFTVTNLDPGGSDFSQGQAAVFGVEPPTGDIEYCQPSTVYSAATDTIADGSNENRYGNYTNCSWTIQPSGAGLIYINFTEVALDRDMDVVYIYNGTSTSDPLVATVTGYDIPQEILVWGPSAYVVFQSDGMLRADGWSFYYVSSQVGIEDAWNNGKISVFPNPADDRMSVEIDPLVLPAIRQIELLSFTGQVLQVISNPMQSQILDVSDLAPGTYGLRFVGDNDSYFSFIEVR